MKASADEQKNVSTPGVSEPFEAAYQQYLGALSEAAAAAQRTVAETQWQYMSPLRSIGTTDDVQRKYVESMRAAWDQAQGGAEAAYRGYTRALKEAWARVDLEALDVRSLDVRSLDAIAQSALHVCWMASGGPPSDNVRV
jgi:hypothetical protein